MKQKKGILIISPFFRPMVGGQETHLTDLTDYLRKKDYYVFVVTYNFNKFTFKRLNSKIETAQKIEIKDNLEIHRLSFFSYDLFLKFAKYPIIEFLYLFPCLFLHSFYFTSKHKHKFNIIHAHGLVAALIASIISKIFNKKTLVSLHTDYGIKKNSYFSMFVKMTLNKFDTIFTLSNKAREDLITKLPSEKIKVYTYWVDQTIFRPLNKIKCKTIMDIKSEFLVLFVGRLTEIKGVKVLIEVASIIKNVDFYFIGVGPLLNEVKKASLINKNIILIGKVENEDLPLYYNAADVVVVPSQYEEGFGRVVIESLSCGTPVIASNRGGLPEAFNPSVGVLIEPTVENIVQKIQFFYENPKELEKLKSNCRSYAIERFSEKNAELIEKCYQEG